MIYAAPRRCALLRWCGFKEGEEDRREKDRKASGRRRWGRGGGVLLNSQYEPSRKSLAPTKEFMLHLPGGFFHFDFEVCPPPPGPTMPETTKNFFQHCDKQAKCQSLRTCWGYTTLFGGAAKGRNISKYGEKKMEDAPTGKFWAVIYTNIWIPIFASVVGELAFVLLYPPFLPGKYN